MFICFLRKVCFDRESVRRFDWLISFQGEAGPALSLPKCEPGEYLTSDGKQLLCVKFGTLCNTSIMCPAIPGYCSNSDVAVSFQHVILVIHSRDKN